MTPTKASVFDSVLQKVRRDGVGGCVPIWLPGGVGKDIYETLGPHRIPWGLTKTERLMFQNRRFTDEDMEMLYRAFCIRQRLPWEAPGTTKEIAEEVSAQMKLTAASMAPLFKDLDYYLKVLRSYPQHWDSLTVEDAVVCALKRVGDADQLYMLTDHSWEETEENRWAINFFEEPDGAGYDDTPLKKAVDTFFNTCKAIMDACHCKPDTVYRKRDIDEVTAAFQRRLAPKAMQSCKE